MHRIAVLCGGVGAARFLAGLVDVVDPAGVTAIVNVADDEEFYGLHVSPDIDTVLYTLAGVVEESQGWGRRGETYNAQAELARFGEDTWFRLGDRDLGAHIHRSRRLRDGDTLTEITDGMRNALGIFVKRRTADIVRELRFETDGPATPRALEAIAAADAIVVAPSNPFVSIGPILELAGIREAIGAARATVVAVSPIVGGAAIKGPAAAMLAALGHDVSALGVARLYRDLADTFVLDEQDRALAAAVEALGLRVTVAPTIMRDTASRAALARTVVAAAGLA